MSGAGTIARGGWLGTVVFTVSAIAAVASKSLRPVGAAVALVEFAVGCVAFLWAYGRAVARSRYDAIGIGGLYFLAGDVAPAPARRSLRAALAVQCVVAFVTAALRPFTSLAFGVLVPMFGLGLMGLWAARHGQFAPRPIEAVAEPAPGPTASGDANAQRPDGQAGDAESPAEPQRGAESTHEPPEMEQNAPHG